MAVILAHLFLTIVYKDNSNIPTTFVKTNIEKCDEKAESVSKDLQEAIQVLELEKNQEIYSTNLCLMKILQKLFALQYELTASGPASQNKKYRYTFSKPALIFPRQISGRLMLSRPRSSNNGASAWRTSLSRPHTNDGNHKSDFSNHNFES